MNGPVAAGCENKENEPPKNKTRRRGKRPAPRRGTVQQQHQDAARQQQLLLLAKRVIAPIAIHPKYKKVEKFLRFLKGHDLQKFKAQWVQDLPQCLVKGTVLDLRAVYQKILRREYHSAIECIGDIDNLWASLGDIKLENFGPLRELSEELSHIWMTMYLEHEFEELHEKVPEEKRSATTWDCNPLDKPVLRAVGKNYCVCCTNPVSICAFFAFAFILCVYFMYVYVAGLP